MKVDILVNIRNSLHSFREILETEFFEYEDTLEARTSLAIAAARIDYILSAVDFRHSIAAQKCKVDECPER